MPPLLDTQGYHWQTKGEQMKSHHPKIRKTLREHADGATINRLAELLSLKYESVRKALANMPDVYIDRWTRKPKGKRYEAVWFAVIPPENCPPPTKK